MWATTTKGQKWLGSAKAAAQVARNILFRQVLSRKRSSRNGTLMLTEFLDVLSNDIVRKTDLWDDLITGALYVCEYCDVDLGDLDHTEATDVLAVVAAYANMSNDEMVVAVTECGSPKPKAQTWAELTAAWKARRDM